MTVIFEQGDPRRELFATARFGMELETAKDSPLYQFLIDRARDAANQAMLDLVAADATDVGGIMSFQNEVKRLQDIERWLDEAINAGQLAYDELHAADYT